MVRAAPPPFLRAASLALAAAAAGCGGGKPPFLNAVVVTLDTTRADAIGCFGGPAGLTPVLDGLAEEAVAYQNARTVVPLTLPAHASMFTGLYPPRHTIRDNNVVILPPSARTLAERARERGVQTAAFVSAAPLDRVFGLDQGFELYDQPERPFVQATSHAGERRAEDAVARASRFVAGRDPDRPFLLWVHLFDPHAPYEPPAAFKSKAGGNAYRGEVAYMDAMIGRLFDALREADAWENTLVLVVSDHGEALGQHDEFTHGNFCYATTMRAPFLVRDPGGERRGEDSDEVVSVVDVYPTVIDALGLGSPGDVDGESLFRRRVPEDRGVYFESYGGYLSYGWSPLAGWADRAGAYVHSSAPRFFAGNDEGDAGRALTGAELESMKPYRDAIAAVAARPKLAPAAETAGEEMLAAMRRLGYAASGDASQELPHPLEQTGLPSPHDRKDELRRTQEALILSNQGRYDEAIPLFRSVVLENPRNMWALDRLGNCYVITNRFAEAIEPLQRLLAIGPPWAGTHYNLGVALYQTGRQDEGLDHFRAAVRTDPGHVQALFYLAQLLEQRGEKAEAARYRAMLEAAKPRGEDLPPVQGR